MYTKSILTKNAIRNAFSLLSLLVMTNTLVLAQTESTSTPVFEIIKIQDGSESGDEVVYKVNVTDGAGKPLVNTTSEDFSMDIEFGVDSDVERNDMATEFPTSIFIAKGKSSTVIRLKVLNDIDVETTENLVAMIYNPSIGTISETLSYATATVLDNDTVTIASKTNTTSNTASTTEIQGNDNNPVITMLR